MIVVTRVDARTHEATLSHAGREIGTLRRVISGDGKKMTVSDLRRIPPTDNVEVYDKDEQ